jgi:hypothetical protein
MGGLRRIDGVIEGVEERIEGTLCRSLALIFIIYQDLLNNGLLKM